MKKLLAILSACITITTAFISCGSSKDDTEKQSQTKTDAKDIIDSDSGSDKAANDFAKYLCGESDSETHLNLILPEVKIEELKHRGEWDNVIKYDGDQLSDILEDYQIVVKEVKKGDELTETQLEYVGSYFEKSGISDIEAEKGYEYTITVEQIERETNHKETPQTTVCIFKVDDEWKLIPMSAEALSMMYEKAD